MNNVFSFLFHGRSYSARLLPAAKPGENDALVYGLDLSPKAQPKIIHRGATGWWSATGKLTPLAQAALKAGGQ